MATIEGAIFNQGNVVIIVSKQIHMWTYVHPVVSNTQILTHNDTHSARSAPVMFIVLQASSHVYFYYKEQYKLKPLHLLMIALIIQYNSTVLYSRGQDGLHFLPKHLQKSQPHFSFMTT